MPRAASGPGVAALVVALERAPGERFTPALATLRGRPLYAWSVDRLTASPAISETHVLLPARALARFRRAAAAAGWQRVTACAVTLAILPPFAALLAALESPIDSFDGAIESILVHDAAYPLLNSSALDTVLAASGPDQLAIAATPVKDTLKLVDPQGLVIGTPPRDRLWQAQSPILAPRALLAERLLHLANALWPYDRPQAMVGEGWLRELCTGLPAQIVPIGADAPHVRTRADARALAKALPSS